MISKYRKTLVISAFVLSSFVFTQAVISWANGSTSGSVDDPLITKSYLDQQLSNLVKQEIQAQLKGGQAAPTTAPTTAATPVPTAVPSAATSELVVVQLKAGQTLYAGAGTELIVRTGKTVAVSTDSNGIPDVTAGKDIAANSPIELNHLLIFPREGRGIKPDPTNKGDIFVMVRGSYVVLNADGTKAS